MPAQTDFFGVIEHYIYHGAKKDKFIYGFFACLAPLIDVALGRAKLRKELFGKREEIQPHLKYVCLMQTILFTVNLTMPLLATHLSTDLTATGWSLVSTAAFMPLLCLLGTAKITKQKIVYAIAVLALTLFSLPGTGMSELLPWFVMLLGSVADCLFYYEQHRYGEFRVEVAIGSAFIFSVLYFLFGTPTLFILDDLLNLFAFVVFSWMYQQAKSRYSMNVVDSDPFLMSMARLEKVSILLFLAFLATPANYKARGSMMAGVFVTILCFSAAQKKKEE